MQAQTPSTSCELGGQHEFCLGAKTQPAVGHLLEQVCEGPVPVIFWVGSLQTQVLLEGPEPGLEPGGQQLPSPGMLGPKTQPFLHLSTQTPPSSFWEVLGHWDVS